MTELPVRTPGAALALVSGPTPCPLCGGDEWITYQRKGLVIEVACPGCCCNVCGKPGAAPECARCFEVEDMLAVRREDR